MLEVEMKFTGADHDQLQRRLAEWGARADPPRQEADHYFNAPDRDFAQTDEALRVRRVGSANFVTYKGPKRDLQTKTRTEIEVQLAEGERAAEDFMKVLTHLGYRPVAVVRKRRRILHLERGGFALEVCLDAVDGLGAFAELEVQAPEERLPAARAAIQELATELGLTTSERRSYLELLLTLAGGKPP
jgi:adenylate cyclase class 2